MAKQISRQKMAVMNSDSYLFSIGEAALMLRRNREKFEKEFLETGELSFVLIGNRKYIRHSTLKEYLKKNEYVQQTSEN